MFCYQCEQTAAGKGCDKYGVCGKSPEVANLQDLLVHALKGLSQVAVEGRRLGIEDPVVNHFTCKAMFATLTNVNFDPDRIKALIEETVRHREALMAQVRARGGATDFEGPSRLWPENTIAGMVEQGAKVGILSNLGMDRDVHSLVWTLTYGLKGISAYADHAAILGKEDPEVYRFIQEALVATLDKNATLQGMLDWVMRAGETNLRAMELLDQANTGTYGDPVPTKVPLGHMRGKAILVSGHDLHDMELLLKQTEGRGIYVYTHGEMLPTHGYPKLKTFSHFYGHYGTAWQNQQSEFPKFPGSILMTTNCIQRPVDSYKDNIFTTSLVGWPNVQHIGEEKDFTPVIEKALDMPGFKEDSENGFVNVGFGHTTVLGIADKVIDLVKRGKIRHFFLVGGCDGSKLARSYYAEFVEKAPKDTVIMTLACGKFKFFDKQLGDIEGLPRLIDIGQCNDAYSAIQIALALSKAFNVGVNELPLSLILSWYEQKAVAILLTLLSLGIKNIRIGPSLPAFMTPNVLEYLIKNYNVTPIGKAESDLKAILG